MIIQNSLGADISGISLAVNGTNCEVTAAGPAMLTNGEQGTYTATCSPTSGKFRGTLSFSYVKADTGLSHTKTGELIAQIP
jgi:hypothetical protein